MPEPTVSIIIPCYNQAHFVADALQSALGQTYPALEVVVIDDGSTDQLERVVASFGDDPRLKYVAQENRGLPAARNRGIAESHGDYLKFLDADDWLAPTVIQTQTAIFERDPQLGLVYCDLIHVDAEGKPLDDYSVARTRAVLSGDIFPSLLLGGYFPPHAALVPRRVLERVGYFDEALGGSADSELWMRIAAEGYPAYFVPEKLVYYRRHPHTMSRDTQHMEATRLRALEKIVARYPERTARALHAITAEQRRVDRDSAWARETIANQATRITALERALNTRGVRWVRALERWWTR